MRAVSIPETGKLLEDSTNLINWGSYLPVGTGKLLVLSIDLCPDVSIPNS
jgi:hypothetical protein